MTRLLNLIFSCRHPRRTWPLSMLNGKRVPAYTACLDCGAHLPYHAPSDDQPVALAAAREAHA